MKRVISWVITILWIGFFYCAPCGAQAAGGEAGGAPGAVREKENASIDEKTPEEVEKLGLLSEAGDKDASYQLFQMFLHGRSVKKDKRLATEYLRQAAEQGHAIAQYELGNLYDRVKKNRKQALVWYRKAAEGGNAPAQYNIGVSYANGEGVEQDFKKALEWYKKAAERGYALAQYNLGVAYEMGEGAPKDSKTAVKWLRKAAMQGYGLAQFNLGAIYYNGEQVDKDLVAAHAWFELSLKYGAEGAEKFARQGIGHIKSTLSEDRKKDVEILYQTLSDKIERNKKKKATPAGAD